MWFSQMAVLARLGGTTLFDLFMVPFLGRVSLNRAQELEAIRKTNTASASVSR